MSKPYQHPQPPQSTSQNRHDQQLPTQHQQSSKPMPNASTRSASGLSDRRSETSDNMHQSAQRNLTSRNNQARPPKQQNTTVSTEQRPLAACNKQNQGRSESAIVTFAHHIKVHDEEVQQYTFGFFDEQPDQVRQPKLSKTNTNLQSNNPRKQSTQTQCNESKSRQKQSKTSPLSEVHYKFKDTVNFNRANYEQILKFISNCKYKLEAIFSSTCAYPGVVI